MNIMAHAWQLQEQQPQNSNSHSINQQPCWLEHEQPGGRTRQACEEAMAGEEALAACCPLRVCPRRSLSCLLPTTSRNTFEVPQASQSVPCCARCRCCCLGLVHGLCTYGPCTDPALMSLSESGPYGIIYDFSSALAELPALDP